MALREGLNSTGKQSAYYDKITVELVLRQALQHAAVLGTAKDAFCKYSCAFICAN